MFRTIKSLFQSGRSSLSGRENRALPRGPGVGTKSSWKLWMGFLACLAVAAGAMGWISLTALRLEATEIKTRRQAAVEEAVRLALWRMDSALAPVIAQENARPYFAYATFLPAHRSLPRRAPGTAGGQVLMPSPLLTESLPYVLGHFQFDPDGRLSSPRVPSEADRPLAVPKYLSPQGVQKAQACLAQLVAATDGSRLLARLPRVPHQPAELVSAIVPSPSDQQLTQLRRQSDLQSRGRGSVEFDQRNQLLSQNANVAVLNQDSPWSELSGVGDVTAGLMTPLWLDGNLVLARRIEVRGQAYVQGCLLDWQAIRTWLLGSIDDLLPAAQLRPGTDSQGAASEARRLAALPVELAPGDVPAEVDAPSRPVRLSLAVAWAGMAAAALAVAALVAGVVRLSDRRAAFVSAVTHELRTPLTTFHMYTEMLTEGMVAPDRQQEYLRTLRAEASRLSHLVENVLAYARLERGRRGGTLQTVTAERLLEPIRGRLVDRATQAGMELVVEAEEPALSAAVRTSPSVVDQILFNLVDNACKYAATAADTRIHLALDRQGDRLLVRVRDHGPGLAGPRSRRFVAFSKSAREAANSAPGVGLGLALSQRLARDMDADLRLDPSVVDGACFALSLPLVDESALG